MRGRDTEVTKAGQNKAEEDREKKELVRRLSMGRDGIELKQALELCLPRMRSLCGGDEPGEWLSYSFRLLQAEYFPDHFSWSEDESLIPEETTGIGGAGQKAFGRQNAVRFFLDVLEGGFRRERQEAAFSPFRDFAFLSVKEEESCDILSEYHRFRQCAENGVYAFMRLSRVCTPYNTLGHIAGVHHVAMHMGRQLSRLEGARVDLGLLSAAAFLHDIGKFGCRQEEMGRVPYLHYYYTYCFCRRQGMDAIGMIAANHSVWDLELENLPVESLLLIYADFRVRSVFDEHRREQIRIWSLNEAYQIILGKLDHVDEQKKARYTRVFAKLKDFEEYMIYLGCSPDLESIEGHGAEPGYPALMTQRQLADQVKMLAIRANLEVMVRTGRKEEFLSELRQIRSRRDWRDVRSFLTAIEEYAVYLPQEQKKEILNYLRDLLSHRDGDIRRQAARTAGLLMADYELKFTKELPEGSRMPRVGEPMRTVWAAFLDGLLRQAGELPWRQRRWSGYAMKTVLRTLMAKLENEQRVEAAQVYVDLCREAAGDELNSFFLIDGASELPFDQTTQEQHREMEHFAEELLSSRSGEIRTASLRFLLTWMKCGWRAEKDLSVLIGTRIPEMNKEPYCIQYLSARIREYYGIPSERGILFYDLTALYTENQREEIPWIYKLVNLSILKERVGRMGEQLYPYVSHLLNMLQFGSRIANRLRAGEDLVQIIPSLPAEGRYEVMLELTRALEIGEYAVSRYIPRYFGRVFDYLRDKEKLEILGRLEHLAQSEDQRIFAAVLEAAGSILRHQSAKSRPVRLKAEGILLSGLAREDENEAREAFYQIGNSLFGSPAVPLEKKRLFFQELMRKILTLPGEENLEKVIGYHAAALNHIYRFITDCRLRAMSLEQEEGRGNVFFPGTFDPFSLGHKKIVEEIVRMGFRVYLAVDEFSWSKRTQPFGIRRRIAAMSTADLQEVFLYPEDIPINIANPEDIRRLEETLGGSRLYLAVGSDVVTHASAYRKDPEPHSVHTLNHIIFARNEQNEQELTAPAHGGVIQGEVLFVRLPVFFENISSSLIRSSVTQGRDIEGLVDARARRYILSHGLYSMEPAFKRTARFSPIDRLIRREGAQECFCLQDGSRQGEICASLLYHELNQDDLLSEGCSLALADRLRGLISGRCVAISRIRGERKRWDDKRLTVLNEALEYFQEERYSFAVCLESGKKEREVLRLHGFLPIAQTEGAYLLDLRAPLVLFYDTPAVVKEPLADNGQVKQVIRDNHIRLLDALTRLYPGQLILCFEANILNYRLIRLITQANGTVLEEKEQAGEKICVPFGKILKGVKVPNTVTKGLDTEKVYDSDLKNFAIRQFPGFASLSLQLRTIRSFHRPMILVDDLLHDGYRVSRIREAARRENICEEELIVGVLSGHGGDLARMRGERVEAAYRVPNLRSWLIESDLYPFSGGDSVEKEGGWAEAPDLLPSINPILPYQAPSFLRGADIRSVYRLSAVCLENARRFYCVLEQEYEKRYHRRLTAQRLGEVMCEPRYPDGARLGNGRDAFCPSEILTREQEKLKRLAPLALWNGGREEHEETDRAEMQADDRDIR